MDGHSVRRTLRRFSDDNKPLRGLHNWLQHFDGVGSKSLVAAYESGDLATRNEIEAVWQHVHKNPLELQRFRIRYRLGHLLNPDPNPQGGGKRRSATAKRRRTQRRN